MSSAWLELDGADPTAELCGLCLKPLPPFGLQRVMFPCCGQGLHKACVDGAESVVTNAAAAVTKGKIKGKKGKNKGKKGKNKGKRGAGTSKTSGKSGGGGRGGKSKQCLMCRAGVATTPKATFARCMRWADQGKAWAMTMIADHYQNGFGVPASSETARIWFKKAADLGCPKAQYNLACMHHRGFGGPVHTETARAWYQKSAKQGFKDAAFTLGLMYFKGEGGPRDLDKARVSFTWAAKQNDHEAAHNLALMYQKGQGGPQNIPKARHWFEQAAERGQAEAQVNIALLEDFGDGGPEDKASARRWYQKAAEQGVAKAQFRLGNMHRNGEGGLSKSPEMSRVWLKKAAESGHVGAQCNLAAMHSEGVGGPVSVAKARHWYKMAAESGDMDAMFNYACFFRDGSGGAKSLVMARKWYEKAAAMGCPDSHYSLAGMYFQAQGGYEKDEAKGVAHVVISAKKGYRMAIKPLRNLKATGYPIPCFECGKTTETLSGCSKCWGAYYCSRDCQVKAWKVHKPVCKQIRREVPMEPAVQKKPLARFPGKLSDFDPAALAALPADKQGLVENLKRISELRDMADRQLAALEAAQNEKTARMLEEATALTAEWKRIMESKMSESNAGDEATIIGSSPPLEDVAPTLRPLEEVKKGVAENEKNL
jgi:TPR repeat protein